MYPDHSVNSIIQITLKQDDGDEYKESFNGDVEVSLNDDSENIRVKNGNYVVENAVI